MDRCGDGPHRLLIKAFSNLAGIFRIGFADRGIGILRRVHRLFDGRRGGFGPGAEFEFDGRTIRLHAIQMREGREWKLFVHEHRMKRPGNVTKAESLIIETPLWLLISIR